MHWTHDLNHPHSLSVSQPVRHPSVTAIQQTSHSINQNHQDTHSRLANPQPFTQSVTQSPAHPARTSQSSVYITWDCILELDCDLSMIHILPINHLVVPLHMHPNPVSIHMGLVWLRSQSYRIRRFGSKLRGEDQPPCTINTCAIHQINGCT